MPHIILEHSANVDLPSDLSELFLTIHKILAEKLPTQVASCKSRVIKYGNYYLADCDQNNAFIHLSVKIMKGRSDTLKNEVGGDLQQVIKSYVSAFGAANSLNLDVTVEILDLQNYIK